MTLMLIIFWILAIIIPVAMSVVIMNSMFDVNISIDKKNKKISILRIREGLLRIWGEFKHNIVDINGLLPFFIMTLVGSMVVFLFSILFAFCVIDGLCPIVETIHEGSMDIYSINLANSVNGQFTLGSGSISGSEQYAFFTKNSDGSFQRKHASIDTKVYQSTNKPHLSWKTHTFAYKYQWVMKTEPKPSYNSDYAFYIPENSIVERFNLQ